MLEGQVDAVIGVDTHRDRHAAAILDANGGLVAQVEVEACQGGYEQLFGFVTRRRRVAAVGRWREPAATARA